MRIKYNYFTTLNLLLVLSTYLLHLFWSITNLILTCYNNTRTNRWDPVSVWKTKWPCCQKPSEMLLIVRWYFPVGVSLLCGFFITCFKITPCRENISKDHKHPGSTSPTTTGNKKPNPGNCLKCTGRRNKSKDPMAKATRKVTCKMLMGSSMVDPAFASLMPNA